MARDSGLRVFGLGLYRDNATENGNYYRLSYNRVYIGVIDEDSPM